MIADDNIYSSRNAGISSPFSEICLILFLVQYLVLEYIRTVEMCYFRHIIPKPEDAQTVVALSLYKDDGVVNTEAVLTTTVPL